MSEPHEFVLKARILSGDTVLATCESFSDIPATPINPEPPKNEIAEKILGTSSDDSLRNDKQKIAYILEAINKIQVETNAGLTKVMTDHQNNANAETKATINEDELSSGDDEGDPNEIITEPAKKKRKLKSPKKV